MIVLRKMFTYSKSPRFNFKQKDDINFWKKYENKDLSKVSDQKLKELARYEEKNPDDVMREVKKIAAGGMSVAGTIVGTPIGFMAGAAAKKPLKGATIGGVAGAASGAATGAFLVGHQHRRLKKIAKRAKDELERRNKN